MDLQKVDAEIAALRRAAEAHPRQLAELEKELSTARAAVEAERTRALEIERQRRTLEQNIADEKDKVKKWESRLTEQRSPREYAALAREIDIAKKANVNMTEELGELAKQLTAARESAKAKEQEFAARQDQIGGKMAEVKKAIEASSGHVKTLEGKRAEALKTVDARLLQRYEQVRKKRSPSLVSVVSGTCQGCNMNVPPQLYNTLRTSLGLDVCPSCHRIIFAAEALEEPNKA